MALESGWSWVVYLTALRGTYTASVRETDYPPHILETKRAMLAQNGVRCVGLRNVYWLSKALKCQTQANPGNVSKRLDCGCPISLCALKRMICIFVAEKGWKRRKRARAREDGMAPEGRGGGRSERRTVCKLLSFSTRRQLSPCSSLSSNLPKWRPEWRSTLSNQLASLVEFCPNQVIREL